MYVACSDHLTDALYLVVKQIFIMDLVIFNAHTIHYHMNSSQSVALYQRYFTYLDYLVNHHWIWATLLHPTNITPAGTPNVWGYFLLFEGVVGYTSNGASCYYIVIFHSLSLHVTTTYPLPPKSFRVISLSTDSMYISTIR